MARDDFDQHQGATEAPRRAIAAAHHHFQDILSISSLLLILTGTGHVDAATCPDLGIYASNRTGMLVAAPSDSIMQGLTDRLTPCCSTRCRWVVTMALAASRSDSVDRSQSEASLLSWNSRTSTRLTGEPVGLVGETSPM